MNSRDMIGQSIAHYQIAASLGAGGMGEVFRARDTKLGREVAVKFLTADYAESADQLRRFEQEERTLGALNHPNILSIFDTGTHEGRPYLVSELLEGQTLREVLSGAQLPVRKATEYALQFAQGLAAAHGKGVIHRDLKPENLFVTQDGRVKILDFGLAKLRPVRTRTTASQTEEGEVRDGVESVLTEIDGNAATRLESTEPGVVLGTPSYMSPEQVRGEAADHRSDIFAFGAILYEMLSQQRAFRRETPVETMNAILKEEPPELAEQLPNLPPALERIVRRCLEKQPDRRFQSASDLAFALENVSTTSSSAARSIDRSAARWKGRSRILLSLQIVWVSGLVGLGCILTWFLKPSPSPSPLPKVQFEIRLPEGERLAHGYSHGLAISPDGHTLAFVSGIASNLFVVAERRQIWLRHLDQVEARPVPGTESGVEPVFSPDGQWLAFTTLEQDGSTSVLKKMPLNGGQMVTLFRGNARYGVSWGPDDAIMLGNSRGGLLRLRAAGGQAEAITKVDEAAGEVSHRLPHVLPNGKAVLYTAVRHRIVRLTWDEMDVWVFSLASGERKLLIQGGADARYVQTGHLAFVREGQLLMVPFDPDRLAVTGPEFRMLENVSQALYGATMPSDSGTAQFAFSGTSLLAYAPGSVLPERLETLIWVDRRGQEEPIPVAPKSYQSLRVSPAGDQLLLTSVHPPTSAVWLYDVKRGILRRQTFEGRSSFAAWGPSDGTFTFDWSRKDATALHSKAVDSGPGGAVKLNVNTPLHHRPGAWSPDGQWLAYVVIAENTGVDIWLMPRDGEPKAYLDTKFDEGYPDFSQDSQWIAYASNESGRPEVYIRRFQETGPALQVSVSGGSSPVWSRDGREIFYLGVDSEKDTFFSAGVHINGNTVQIEKPVELFRRTYQFSGPARSWDVAPDGRFLLRKHSTADAEKRLVRQVFPDRIQIIQSWFQGLKKEQ